MTAYFVGLALVVVGVESLLWLPAPARPGTAPTPAEEL